MTDRQLTPIEALIVEALDLETDFFLGKRIDEYQVVRRDPYFVVQRREIAQGADWRDCIDGLELERNLRFGNHMAALANAYALAKSLGFSLVVIPENPLLRHEFRVGQVRFTQSQLPINTLKGTFFYRHTFAHHYNREEAPIEILAHFEKSLQCLRGTANISKLAYLALLKRIRKDLTIHIRSGDIFEGDNPHPGYWQPPLSFYVDTVARHEPRIVTLVFENQSNPVIAALIDWLREDGIRVRIRDGTLEEAIMELASARKVVGGRGSFLDPILALSKQLKSLDSFGTSRYKKLPRVVRGDASFVEWPSAGYENLVFPWMDTESQRSSMLTWQSTDR